MPIEPAVRGNTLQPLVTEYLRARTARGELLAQSARSMSYTLGRLADTHGRRPLTQFGPKTIDRWLEVIGGFAPATRRLHLSRARGLCAWMVANGHLKADPTRHVPTIRQPRHVPVTLTDWQVAALLAVLPDTRAEAIVWLLIGCGLRCVELERLRVEDYDPHARTILVRGKGGHERVLPVPTPTADALDRHLDVVGRRAGPVFAGQRGPLRAVTFGVYVRRWLVESGVKVGALDGRSAHGLRRTAGSDVMARTGNLQLVQTMLGHAKPETTARFYLRPVSVEQLREAMEGRTYALRPVS